MKKKKIFYLLKGLKVQNNLEEHYDDSKIFEMSTIIKKFWRKRFHILFSLSFPRLDMKYPETKIFFQFRKCFVL